MAKAKVTRKWLADNYICCGVGYCDLQYLLRYQSENYYTCGIYGWNFDAYVFGNYCITTGYRNMIHEKEAVMPSKYDDMAWAILKDSSLDYEEKKIKINNLLRSFLKETFKTDFSNLVY